MTTTGRQLGGAGRRAGDGRLQPPEASPPSRPSLPDELEQVTTLDYKRPDGLRPGRVLVVGASATGLQIADELLRSGREVTVAVGEHVRMPRTYRGRDIMWWLDRIGRLDERYDQVDDLVRARHVPSPQLVGTPDRADLDLNALTARGAELVGRLAAVRDGHALFSGSLRNVCNLADLKLVRLLDTIDARAAEDGLGDDAIARPEPTRVPDSPRLDVDLVADGYETVLWATGFRSDYAWLDAAGARPQGRAATRRRHRPRRARALPHRAQLPAPPQVELHPRRRGRRDRPRRGPRRAPRRINQDISYQLCVVS